MPDVKGLLALVSAEAKPRILKFAVVFSKCFDAIDIPSFDEANLAQCLTLINGEIEELDLEPNKESELKKDFCLCLILNQSSLNHGQLIAMARQFNLTDIALCELVILTGNFPLFNELLTGYKNEGKLKGLLETVDENENYLLFYRAATCGYLSMVENLSEHIFSIWPENTAQQFSFNFWSKSSSMYKKIISKNDYKVFEEIIKKGYLDIFKYIESHTKDLSSRLLSKLFYLALSIGNVDFSRQLKDKLSVKEVQKIISHQEYSIFHWCAEKGYLNCLKYIASLVDVKDHALMISGNNYHGLYAALHNEDEPTLDYLTTFPGVEQQILEIGKQADLSSFVL